MIAIDNKKDIREPEWPKGLYRRGASYKFIRTANGKKFLDVFGPVSLDEAIRRVTRFNFDIADGKEPATIKESLTKTFRHLAGVWLEQKNGKVSPASYTRYRAVTDNFTYFLESKYDKHLPLSDIDYSIAADYIAHRRNSPLMPNGSRKFTRAFRNGASKATLHFEKETLHRLFNEARRRKLIDENPFDNVEAKKPSRKEIRACRHPLEIEEQKALEQAAILVSSPGSGDACFADIITFFTRTGERDDEMVHLEWTDTDWKKNVINVEEKTVTEVRRVPIPTKSFPVIQRLMANRAADEALFRSEAELISSGVHLDIREKDALLRIKVGEIDLEKKLITTSHTFKWTPKGSAGDIPMCKTVREILQRLKKTSTSNFVFAHHDGGKCRLRLLDLLKKAQKLAGIKGRLRIHDLRHTFGVRLREQGKRLETIMGLMRHADIEETLLYAPYTEDEGKKAIECFDALDELAKSA